jgi:hypothetical protein
MRRTAHHGEHQRGQVVRYIARRMVMHVARAVGSVEVPTLAAVTALGHRHTVEAGQVLGLFDRSH